MGPRDSQPGASDASQDRVPSSPLPGPSALRHGSCKHMLSRRSGWGWLGQELGRTVSEQEVVPSLSAIGSIEFCFVLCVWFCFLNN